MNDLELMLVTIGDLEFTRRKQAQEIQELKAAEAAREASASESDDA
jgi:hypothetical protein